MVTHLQRQRNTIVVFACQTLMGKLPQGHDTKDKAQSATRCNNIPTGHAGSLPSVGAKQRHNAAELRWTASTNLNMSRHTWTIETRLCEGFPCTCPSGFGGHSRSDKLEQPSLHPVGERPLLMTVCYASTSEDALVVDKRWSWALNKTYWITSTHKPTPKTTVGACRKRHWVEEAPTQALLVLHRTRTRFHRHQGQTKDLSVSSLTKGKWMAVLLQHGDGETRRLGPWTSSTCHRDSTQRLYQLGIHYKQKKNQQTKSGTTKLLLFVLARAFVQKCQPPTTHTARHRGQQATWEEPAAVDMAWEVTLICQTLVCGIPLLDGTDTHKDVLQFGHPCTNECDDARKKECRGCMLRSQWWPR